MYHWIELVYEFKRKRETVALVTVGLETGGDSPKEIAISAAAQRLQVHCGIYEKQ